MATGIWSSNRRSLGAMALATVLLAAALSGCGGSSHHRTDVAVSSGYDYVYYPDQQVYYYPSGGVYYWHEPLGWRYGSALPRHYHPAANRGVPVHINSARPYDHHREIRRSYPPVPPPRYNRAPSYTPHGVAPRAYQPSQRYAPNPGRYGSMGNDR